MVKWGWDDNGVGWLGQLLVDRVVEMLGEVYGSVGMVEMW